jgi:hypothetical protein
MHGLVLPIALRQVLPRRSGAQNPKDPIEDLTAISPGPSTPIGAYAVGRQECTYDFPLFVR